MAKIIAFTNLKGGSGKTTSVTNTAYALASMDKKVLVVDCDPQGNASMTLGKIPVLDQTKTIGDVFSGGELFFELIQKSKYEYIDLIASNLNVVADLTSLPPNSIKRFFGFKQSLDEETLKNYEYIILDCPPSIDGAPLVNALVISDYVIIPVDGTYALSGVTPLLEAIETVKRDAQVNINILGIIITQQDNRTNESAALKEALIHSYGDKFIFKTTIPKNATIKESQIVGKAVCDHNKKCSGCIAYQKFAIEMLEKINC